MSPNVAWDDRLGPPRHTSAIRLKYEDHWRFLCRTCELVQAVRATNIPVASVCGCTDIFGNIQHAATVRRVWNFFVSILGLGIGHFDRRLWFASVLQATPNIPSITPQPLSSRSFPIHHSQFNLPSTLPTVRKDSTISYTVKSSEIIPTRCNNCVYSSQWLYSTCFGWQFHPSSGVQCCIWPFR